MSADASDALPPTRRMVVSKTDRRTLIDDVTMLACVGVVPHLLQCVSFYASQIPAPNDRYVWKGWARRRADRLERPVAV